MAKASISIVCEGCGTSFVKERICQNRADADSYEAWAANHVTLCWRCLRAERESDTLIKAAEIVGDRTLPALDGSDKQVAWALKIRAEAIVKRLSDPDYFADMYDCSREKLDAWVDLVRKDYPGDEAEYTIKNCTIDWTIIHGSSAKWLIDSRNDF